MANVALTTGFYTCVGGLGVKFILTLDRDPIDNRISLHGQGGLILSPHLSPFSQISLYHDNIRLDLGDYILLNSIFKLIDNVSTMLYTPYLLSLSSRREKGS